MAEGKRYYWLKLKDDFFSSKRIKKLRNMAGGDTYTIIYLKMQLLAMKTEGILTWTGLEDSFADELALDLDEAPDDVAVTLMYLLNRGLAETQDEVHFYFPYAVENTGSEGASAQRVRKHREQLALQCNTDVTPVKRIGNGEIEIEKETDIESEKRKKKRFTPPTLEEVKDYVRENGYHVDPEYFYSYYAKGEWIDGQGKPVLNWKQKLITWEKKDAAQQEAKPRKQYTTAAEYQAPKKINADQLRRLREDFGI